MNRMVCYVTWCSQASGDRQNASQSTRIQVGGVVEEIAKSAIIEWSVGSMYERGATDDGNRFGRNAGG